MLQSYSKILLTIPEWVAALTRYGRYK